MGCRGPPCKPFQSETACPQAHKRTGGEEFAGFDFGGFRLFGPCIGLAEQFPCGSNGGGQVFLPGAKTRGQGIGPQFRRFPESIAVDPGFVAASRLERGIILAGRALEHVDRQGGFDGRIALAGRRCRPFSRIERGIDLGDRCLYILVRGARQSLVDGLRHLVHEGGSALGLENRLKVDIDLGNRVSEHFARRLPSAFDVEHGLASKVMGTDDVEGRKIGDRVLGRLGRIDAALASLAAFPTFAGRGDKEAAASLVMACGRLFRAIGCRRRQTTYSTRCGNERGGANAGPEAGAEFHDRGLSWRSDTGQEQGHLAVARPDGDTSLDQYRAGRYVANDFHYHTRRGGSLGLFIEIADMLGKADLKLAGTVFRQEGGFEDGALTAGRIAKRVKKNEQAKPTGLAADFTALIEKRLMKNEVFRAAARPKSLIRILLSRYRPGMAYGTHSDDAFMDGVRADLSFTLFLSDPGDYDGGELVIEEPSGERLIKLPAGSLVLYPSNTLHRVAEVTKGERRAAAGWVRSLVRGTEERETLFDVALALRQAEATGNEALINRLLKIQGTLLRRWGDD